MRQNLRVNMVEVYLIMKLIVVCPLLSHIRLAGGVQNGTSITLSSGLRRVSQPAVDYANLPKWSDRLPATPAGTYRDVEGFIRPITPTSANAADAMLKALPNAAINTINFVGLLGAATGGGEYTSIPTFKYQNEGLGLAAELAMTGPFAELAASRLGKVGVAASMGIEAQFLTNSQRVADESYSLFVQGIADKSIPRNPSIPFNTQAGGFVDKAVRNSNLKLRDAMGLDASSVRINQRLYAPDGSYTVPDMLFPKTSNIIDYSLQLKTINTPQVQGFRSASPNGSINIVAPSAIRPSYIIGQ